MIGAVFFLTACPQTESENVKSEGIYAEYSVEETGSEVDVSAVFWVGNGPGGTVLDLSDNDEVRVNGRLLRRDKNFGVISYKSTLAKEKVYEFSFIREVDDKVEDYIASIRLPRNIQIRSPKPRQRFRRGTPIKVSWPKGNGETQIRIEISGDGISKETGQSTSFFHVMNGLEDDGRHTIPGPEVDPDHIRGLNQQCAHYCYSFPVRETLKVRRFGWGD